jgi:hypothetical protein
MQNKSLSVTPGLDEFAALTASLGRGIRSGYGSVNSVDLYKRVLEGSLSRDTTRSMASEGYDWIGRHKDSVDHHTSLVH